MSRGIELPVSRGVLVGRVENRTPGELVGHVEVFAVPRGPAGRFARRVACVVYRLG